MLIREENGGVKIFALLFHQLQEEADESRLLSQRRRLFLAAGFILLTFLHFDDLSEWNIFITDFLWSMHLFLSLFHPASDCISISVILRPF